MQTIVVPAVKVEQGNLTLYSCAFRVGQLIRNGFYSVDVLDPADEGKGYQRLLNLGRAKKLAEYIIDGMETRESLLPTSIFIATEKDLEHNSERNLISIDLDDTGPFSVVDGQHRLEGLRLAASEDPRVNEFMVTVNIAVNMPFAHQMAHFLIVNSTQKSVDRSVEQRIMARLTTIIDTDDDAPSLPGWILRAVQRGDEDRALKIVDFLNLEPTSPWFGKVEMANKPIAGTTIKQKSFVKILIKNVLNATNPLGKKDQAIDRTQRLLLNYWRAIAALLFEENQQSVLFQYSGCELFHKFSSVFFIYMQNAADRKQETMQDILRQVFDEVSGEHTGLGLPEYWRSGGPVSGMNSGGLTKVVGSLSDSLHGLRQRPRSGNEDL